MRKFSAVLCLIIALGVTCVAFAHSYKQGDIQIGHIWARATAPGMTTAAIYVPLLNTGKEQDKLTGASSDIAENVMIHENINDNGIKKMRMLDSVVLEPNKPVSLRPGGIHLMVTGLKRQLKESETFPLTLQFEKAGAAKVDVMVENVGAMSGVH
jgi:copper(I)-binding protein